eukprot:6837042-Prymnesium_polylepis.1
MAPSATVGARKGTSSSVCITSQTPSEASSKKLSVSLDSVCVEITGSATRPAHVPPPRARARA